MLVACDAMLEDSGERGAHAEEDQEPEKNDDQRHRQAEKLSGGSRRRGLRDEVQEAIQPERRRR